MSAGIEPAIRDLSTETEIFIFCGRLDSQVKINGFRIEIGEIETELCSIENIQNAAVIKMEDNGKVFLAAVFVSVSEEISGDDIKKILQRKLPAYMIPEVIKRVLSIPLTANGKYDRNKLGILFSGGRVSASEPPVTDTEKKLAGLWEKILSCKVGRNDSFFEMGGDSLKATALISASEDIFHVTLSLGDIFRCPILEDMAEEIDKTVDSGNLIDFLEGEI